MSGPAIFEASAYLFNARAQAMAAYLQHAALVTKEAPVRWAGGRGAALHTGTTKGPAPA